MADETPADLIRRAAARLRQDAQSRMGEGGEWMLAVAESWFQCGEDMAVLHAKEISRGISDWGETVHALWTTTLAAARAYLGEVASNV